MIGNGLTSTGTPVENGLPPKESLPTIQIDTVPSPLSSPTELSPSSAQSNEDPLDDSHIDINIEDEKPPESGTDELKESLKGYIEGILTEAMVVVEKKTGNTSIDTETKIEEQDQNTPAQDILSKSNELITEDDEIKAAAQKIVEEVLTKAQDTVIEQMEQWEKEIAALEFPITFDEAPDRVKDVASNFVKELIGKAVAQAEEKIVPTVPFNFEDVDLMKTNGPWYVRVREAFVRVLRTACFCTPRRHDS